jgi:PAS domain S-box-containing protein
MPPQGAFLEVNNRMCQMTGYTRDEFLQGNGWDLMTPKDPDAHQVRFDSLRQGESIQASRRMIRKDGTTIHTEIIATMLDTETVQAIIRDVTEQRRNEEALRESEANYRRLFEYANDSIFLSMWRPIASST